MTTTPLRSPQVGDYFVETYGYDQTNVTFYKVVGFTSSGKSVRVQRWSSQIVNGSGGPCEYVVPGDSAWDQKVITRRITYPEWSGASSVSVKISDYSYTDLWDGSPQYRTGGGWGH